MKSTKYELRIKLSKYQKKCVINIAKKLGFSNLAGYVKWVMNKKRRC